MCGALYDVSGVWYVREMMQHNCCLPQQPVLTEHSHMVYDGENINW